MTRLRYRPTWILAVLCVYLSCKEQKESAKEIDNQAVNPFVENSVNRDLDAIKKDGVLKALVVYSSTSYFLYKGRPMGFEYELLERLAEHLGLKLEIVVSKDLDSEFEVLNRGDVDLIAHGMTITNQRKWEVDFTEYLYLTKQVLVQRKPSNHKTLSWGNLQKRIIRDPIELIGDTVSIRRNSAYYERIKSLSNEIGGEIFIDTLDSQLSTGEIIDMVVDGTVKYTIADENLAKINASQHSILNVDVPISLSQRIAWVTRKKSPEFRAVINSWIKEQRKTTDYRVIYNKYFKNKRSFKRRIKSDYYSLKQNQISPYDDLIKRYAKKIDWDWRLLASQVYQESKFNPKAKSWAGARGLMQVIPATARELGIEDVLNPEESIRGGTTYLSQIYKRFEGIPDRVNRIKFTLAAYNCGFGHVLDAQRLAEAEGLNPEIWTGHVDKMIRALSLPRYYNKPFIKYGYVRGSEPADYVAQIFERFRHYETFISAE